MVDYNEMPKNEKDTINDEYATEAPAAGKTKIDVDALTNKMANTAGKYARKGFDFIGSVLNPNNLKVAGEKIKAVGQSVSEGWRDAGSTEDPEVSHEFDDIKDKIKSTMNKANEKINDMTDKIREKAEELNTDAHGNAEEEIIEVEETEEAPIKDAGVEAPDEDH